MNLSMKKLEPNMWKDFLYYFDEIAFTDHEEFSACYCLESHLNKEEEEQYDTKEKRRTKAKQLIQQGIMKGFLLYDDSNVIGWCNADEKMNYSPVADNAEYHTSNTENTKTIVLYCMEIAPTYRGKGIAHYILDEVCRKAHDSGYQYVECYPFIDLEFPYQYRGPFGLYEKHGFEMIDKRKEFYIMRKRV